MLKALNLETRDALAQKHWPDGMAFDTEHEELLRRGWPHLRLLDSDEQGGKPAPIARKHLNGLDPSRFVRWPREAARLYVRAFAEQGGHPRTTRAKLDAKDAGAVDEDTLDRVLGHLNKLGYEFLMSDALLLSEAFVGSRVAAERTLVALEKLNPAKVDDGPAMWGLVAIGCLELFLLRTDNRVFTEEATDRLRAIERKHGSNLLGDRLRVTLDGTDAYRKVKNRFHYDVRFLSIDTAFFPEYLRHEYADWLYDPQLARMGGPTLAPAKLLSGARRNPAWKQQQRCANFGCIRHAFVVELMAAMVGSKGAKGEPEAWLRAHLDFARPKLEELVRDGHREASQLEAILAGSAEPAAKPRMLTAKQLDTAVVKAFKALSAGLRDARGNVEREREVIQAAVHAIIEARAAAGDPVPEERVGHILMLDGWNREPPPFDELQPSEEEIERWGAAIDHASG